MFQLYCLLAMSIVAMLLSYHHLIKSKYSKCFYDVVTISIIQDVDFIIQEQETGNLVSKKLTQI